MGLLAPAALWLLLPLGAFIVWLYLLKMRRRDQRVPSTMLWQQITADMQANRPWQKLRLTWLLLLQLLAVALLGTAAARPFVRAAGLAGQDLVVVLDNSASMGASDVRPTRLEQARRRALELASKLGRGDRMLVIAASARTRAVSSLTSDRALLERAITSVHQTELDSLMTDALSLAAASRRSGRPMRVVVFSDGTFPDPPEESLRGLNVSLVLLGRSSDNAAVTLCRLDALPDGQRRVFARISNLGRKPIRTNVTLSVGDAVTDAREVALEADSSKGVTFDAPPGAEGLAEVRIRRGDALAADNTAWVALGRQEKARVLLAGPGNVFLEQALALDARLEVSRSASVPGEDALKGFDLIVWDRLDAPVACDANEWFIDAVGTGAPARMGPQQKAAVVLWRPDAPIAGSAGLTDMRYAGFRALQPSDWARVMADSGGAPIIVAGEKGGYRKLSFGWNLLDSDLPLRVTFPILVGNTVEWLLGHGTGASAHAPGDVVRIDMAEGKAPISVQLPGGEAASLAAASEEFTQTERAGVYSWTQGGESGAFAVNLASRDESLVRSRTHEWASPAQKVGGGIPRTNREIAGWFLLAVLALLSLEWLVFHRRL